MPPRPFPLITGSCPCGAISFQLQKPPLFVFACHCTVCQKATGSAFALHANIERTAITVTSETQPVPLASPFRRVVGCQTCGAIMWGNEVFGAPVCDVRVGALDSPGLLVPDWHSFVKAKLGWVTLPPDARTSVGHFDIKSAWPKDSLRRLMVCLEEWNDKGPEAGKEGEEGKEGEKEDEYDGSEGEGERTPTGDDGLSEDEDESDEAFEERFRETERRLTERLETLSLKLDESAHARGGAGVETKAEDAVDTGDKTKNVMTT